MNKVRMILLGVLLLALSTSPVLAQSGHNLFQQALMQERTYGNLEEAIQLYRRIALEFTEDRALAATALVNLGGACEKLGVPGAQDAYRRVVEEFPDQADEARKARARLEALLASPEATGLISGTQDPTYRLVLDKANQGHFLWPRSFDLSPDGRQLVFFSREYGPSGIYLTQQPGDRPHLIYELTYYGPWYGKPRWSPDGSRIAFVTTQDGSEWVEERVAVIIDPAGNEINRFSIPENNRDFTWNPDQQGLTFVVQAAQGYGRTIRSVTFAGHERILAEEGRFPPNVSGYSKDGRWLALAGGRGLQVVPAGGGATRMIDPDYRSSANNSPCWGPEGFLYTVSDRGGTRNIWRVKIDMQTGEATGKPEQVTSYKDAEVTGLSCATDTGALAYILSRARTTVWVAPSTETDTPTALGRGLDPQLSPDGMHVFFEGEDPGNDGVFSVRASGGTPRRLTPDSHSVVPGTFRLWPDGSHVGYVAMVGERREGPDQRERAFFHVAATGGEPERVTFETDHLPEPSPDGSSLAFIRGGGLYVMPVEGGKPTLLAELVEGWGPQWSPDGQTLALFAHDSDPERDTDQVFVIPVEGGELTRLTADLVGQSSPQDSGKPDWEWKDRLSWHADGQSLTYLKSDYSTWMAYLDGRPPTLFLDQDLGWNAGWWARDGRTFFSKGLSENDTWDVYRRNPDGTSELVLIAAGVPSTTTDGMTWTWTTREASAEIWMIEGFGKSLEGRR
jgi:Tol biopolymer transport system component